MDEDLEVLALSLVYQTSNPEDQWRYAYMARLSMADLAHNQRYTGQFDSLFETYANLVCEVCEYHGIIPDVSEMMRYWYAPVEKLEDLLFKRPKLL